MTDFEKVCDYNNLYAAYKKARKGRRGKASVAKFEANLLEALHYLNITLATKTYRMSEYISFEVFEPKRRVVMSAAFKDKVVHHALCDNVFDCRMSKAFIYDNYAAQIGKGTHFGLDRLSGFMQRFYRLNGADGWVLKCDVAKYFYTIQHDALKEIVRKYVTDPGALWLSDLIIDTTENPGIPIGNQTSQWYANIYLNDLDHFIKEKLGIKYYGRYMDDFYLIHESKEYLRHCRGEIEKHISALGLAFNSKTALFPLKNGIDFLGFHCYLTETGKVIRKVRRKSKNNARRRLKKMKGLLDKEIVTKEDIQTSYQSWKAHAKKGNTYHLVRNMDAYFNNLFKE